MSSQSNLESLFRVRKPLVKRVRHGKALSSSDDVQSQLATPPPPTPPPSAAKLSQPPTPAVAAESTPSKALRSRAKVTLSNSKKKTRLTPSSNCKNTTPLRSSARLKSLRSILSPSPSTPSSSCSLLVPIPLPIALDNNSGTAVAAATSDTSRKRQTKFVTQNSTLIKKKKEKKSDVHITSTPSKKNNCNVHSGRQINKKSIPKRQSTLTSLRTSTSTSTSSPSSPLASVVPSKVTPRKSNRLGAKTISKNDTVTPPTRRRRFSGMCASEHAGDDENKASGNKKHKKNMMNLEDELAEDGNEMVTLDTPDDEEDLGYISDEEEEDKCEIRQDRLILPNNDPLLSHILHTFGESPSPNAK